MKPWEENYSANPWEDDFAGVDSVPAAASGVGDVQALEQMSFAGLSQEEQIKRAQIAAQREENPGMTALFPRRSAQVAQGTEGDGTLMGEVSKVGAGTADIFSLAGRFFDSISKFQGDSFEEKRDNFLKSMAETEGEGFVSSFNRSPATGVALLMAPILGPMAAKGAGDAAAAGAIEGTSTALVNQLANLGEGKDMSAGEALADMGLSMALPAGAPLLKKTAGGMKEASRKIMESVIKPSKKLTRRLGSKFDVENIFKYDLDSPKGLKQVKENIKKKTSELSGEYKKAIKDIPFGTKVDLQDALNQAKIKLSREISEEGKHAADYEGIQRGLEYWQKYIDEIGKGKTSVKQSLAIRSEVGEMAKYDKMDVKAVKGTDKAAKYFRNEINGKLNYFPSIRKIDKQMADILPLKEAVDDAIPRIQKNFLQSLNDNPALLSMMAGGGAGGYLGGAKGAAAGMVPGAALMAATRASKSPGFASLMSSGAPKVGLAGELLSNPILQRTIPGLAREPFRQGLAGGQ